MHGLGDQIIAHTRHLRAFYHAKDRLALSTVIALDAAQDDRKEFHGGMPRLANTDEGHFLLSPTL